MRTHLTRTTALASAAALLLTLAGCSGSGSGSDAGPTAGTGSGTGSGTEPSATAEGPQALCDAVARLDELSTTLGDVDPSNPDEAIANLEEITSTLENTDPPAEVADAVDTVSTSFRELTDGMSEALADPTAEDAMTALNDAMASVSSQEFVDATTELNEYTEANC